MKSNSKPFWKFIKSIRHSSTCVLSLNAINCTATRTIDKADALSNQFQSVFTKEDCSNLPTSLESVQRRDARFVYTDFRRQGHVSDMLRDINWKMLEYRRKISRLTLLYKSVHDIVGINIDEHYTNH